MAWPTTPFFYPSYSMADCEFAFLLGTYYPSFLVLDIYSSKKNFPASGGGVHVVILETQFYKVRLSFYVGKFLTFDVSSLSIGD